MRSSMIRSRLRQNLPARIACMYYPTAMMPAHAAKAGFDAIWLDGSNGSDLAQNEECKLEDDSSDCRVRGQIETFSLTPSRCLRNH